MKAQRLFAITSIFGILAVMVSACGGKSDRPPATTSGPPSSTSGSSTAGSRTPASTTPTPPPPVLEPDDDSLASLDDPLNIDAMTLDEINAASPFEDIRFDFDSAALSAEARSTLDQHADVLRRYETMTVLIEGHCDERGTVEYNLALGERRAGAAHDYLVSLGIPSSQLRTISYGKEFPLDPGHDEAAWARNRRAHFEVTAK